MKKLVSLPPLPDSLLILDAENCESMEGLDCSFGFSSQLQKLLQTKSRSQRSHHPDADQWICSLSRWRSASVLHLHIFWEFLNREVESNASFLFVFKNIGDKRMRDTTTHGGPFIELLIYIYIDWRLWTVGHWELWRWRWRLWTFRHWELTQTLKHM